MNKRKIQLLFSIGILIVAGSQVIWHYLEIPDFLNGALIGLGIGLLLFAIRKNNSWKTL
ncbi:hypothetical protein SAMN04488553_1744 [Gramella sp. MAR_2010_147]|nr:hypothetical protein SAMN04488553_1744 [Gramella sp. MAR_2010_147]